MNAQESVSLNTLAAVTGQDRDKIRTQRYRGLAISNNRYVYADALTIEVANQISADGGVSLLVANDLIVMTCGVKRYQAATRAGSAKLPDNKSDDFWIGVLKSRNSTTDENVRHPEISGLSDREHWSGAHASGSLASVIAELQRQITLDHELYPDADAARIFLVNISAADRRLQQRAARVGVRIYAGHFCAV